jgi:hypothetical protein
MYLRLWGYVGYGPNRKRVVVLGGYDLGCCVPWVRVGCEEIRQLG